MRIDGGVITVFANLSVFFLLFSISQVWLILELRFLGAEWRSAIETSVSVWKNALILNSSFPPSFSEIKANNSVSCWITATSTQLHRNISSISLSLVAA